MSNNRKRNREINKAILEEFAPIFERKVYTKMEIAIRLEEARKSKGWSKGELAKRFKKKASVITTSLSGSHNFTVDTLVEIEELLNIELLLTDFHMKEEISFYEKFREILSDAPFNVPEKSIELSETMSYTQFDIKGKSLRA